MLLELEIAEGVGAPDIEMEGEVPVPMIEDPVVFALGDMPPVGEIPPELPPEGGKKDRELDE